MRPLDRKLLRDLRRMWPQAAATALVIGCGVAVFLMMMGAMASLRATRDAARIRAGAEAEVFDWGGGFALPAHVRRIDPAAFTKLSALGVEKQRVEVRLAFDEPARLPEQVGDGWRVLVRIAAARFKDVARVPAAALFCHAQGWAVFAVVDGRARLRRVEIGARNEQFAEVRSGLEPGDRVVLWPSEHVADGVAVVPRTAAGEPPAARMRPDVLGGKWEGAARSRHVPHPCRDVPGNLLECRQVLAGGRSLPRLRTPGAACSAF